ncbi:MAG: hypothetical protein ACOCT9_02490 [archaeon]
MSKQYQKQKVKWKEQGRQEERERIKKIIDKKAEENWDCKECGLVNEKTKTCKKCGDYYYNSTDNRKLYEIMIELNQGENKNEQH